MLRGNPKWRFWALWKRGQKLPIVFVWHSNARGQKVRWLLINPLNLYKKQRMVRLTKEKDETLKQFKEHIPAKNKKFFDNKNKT